MAYTICRMSLKKIPLPRVKLRLFNNFLTIVVALVAIYILVAPYLPDFSWWVKHNSPVKAVVHPQASSPPAEPVPPAQQESIQGDALFIPRLDMSQRVYGGGRSSLSKGVWKLPYTSTPDKGGNTVLVGHRFTYAGPAVLYHL